MSDQKKLTPQEIDSYSHRRKVEFNVPEEKFSILETIQNIKRAKLPKSFKDALVVMTGDTTRSPYLRLLLLGHEQNEVLRWLEEVYQQQETDVISAVRLREAELKASNHALFADPEPYKDFGKAKFLAKRKNETELFRLTKAEVETNKEELVVYLKNIEATVQPRVADFLQGVLNEAGSPGVPLVLRLKGVSSLTEKLARKAKANQEYSLGEMTDIFASRIIVPRLSNLVALDRILTEKLKDSGKLIERDNVYGRPRGDIYRAVNYLFDADGGMIVELQLKTQANACGSEIYHNMVYKQEIYPNLAPEIRDAVTDLAWRMVYADLH